MNSAALKLKSAEIGLSLQQRHLFPFVWRAFELLHPGTPFLPSWHVQAMCHALDGVLSGETKRLIITMPPRYGKSIGAAVGLPALLLGHAPGRKVLVASYGSELGDKHGRDFRTVVTSPWYQRLFPGTRLASGGSRIDEQITTRQGGRKAVSLGGAATGFGADLIIVDDLMKAADATSPAERQRVRDYYEGTLLSRLNDKSNGQIVIIAQRLHEDDLVGHLLETGQFEHLNLRAIAVEDEEIPAGFGRTMVRKRNEALCPEREPLDVLDRLRRAMGPAVFSAQYQQDPTPPGGNRIRWEWFGTYDEDIKREDFQWVVQSWDTGFSAEPTSDFSVCTTWGFRNKKWCLLDLERARLDFPDLKRRAWALAQRWMADCLVIEKAASGIPLLQQLRNDHNAQDMLEAWLPKLDKLTRVEAQSAQLETGTYLLPKNAPWLTDLRKELLGFPNAKHDDQVDSVIQFVEWSVSRRASGVLVERHPSTGRILRTNRPSSVNRPRRSRS